ncbi:aminotransferase class I/II-fold pyridoxal phosphate-dependent enzyme [bacterium]|nr:aminotransferase class I/II-fold pyridoxal phosphate-dependent enzyme [bacterium]
MHRYQIAAERIRQMIYSSQLKPGDKIPSIRTFSNKLGYSTVTIHNAYSILESDGLISAVPRSGFVVNNLADDDRLNFTGEERESVTDAIKVSDYNIASMRDIFEVSRKYPAFGSRYLSPDLIPLEELYKNIHRYLRKERHDPTTLADAGARRIREVIAKRSAIAGVIVNPADVLLTNDLPAAIRICLDAVSERGGKVLLESPSNIPSIAALLRRATEVVEVFSHPKTGVDPDQFEFLVQNAGIGSCIITPVNHYPTGVTYSEETCRRIMEIARKHDVLIIENNTVADLSYSGGPGSGLKPHDKDGRVARIGSFANTLGPRFGISWVIAGDRLKRSTELADFPVEELAGVSAIKNALADFMEQKSYDRYLRRLTQQLSTRIRSGLGIILQDLPERFSVSYPTGGYMCWIRAPRDFDSIALVRRAPASGVSITPGPMFSIAREYRNYFALNLSYVSDDKARSRLKKLMSDLKSDLHSRK